jgi:hypothetical protein
MREAIEGGIAEDGVGLEADAYFDRALPAAERVSLGYGNVVSWDFDLRVDPSQIGWLDRTRLPHGIVDPFGGR